MTKKKKKGGKQAFWNVRKVETIRVQKKDKMKRKHSSGVRKCKKTRTIGQLDGITANSSFSLSLDRFTDGIRAVARFEFGGETRWRVGYAIPSNRPTDRSIKISQASDASSSRMKTRKTGCTTNRSIKPIFPAFLVASTEEICHICPRSIFLRSR